jgi:hypothetical protein
VLLGMVLAVAALLLAVTWLSQRAARAAD